MWLYSCLQNWSLFIGNALPNRHKDKTIKKFFFLTHYLLNGFFPLVLLWFLLFLKIDFCERHSDRARAIFNLLAHCPKSQARIQELCPSLPRGCKGPSLWTRSEVEQLGHKPALKWDACVTISGLTWRYWIMIIPSLSLFNWHTRFLHQLKPTFHL